MSIADRTAAGRDGAVEPGDQGRSVSTTWTYTLGSIVFIYVALYAVLVLTALANLAASSSVVDSVVLALVVVSAATAVRYCWFLRVGRGGGLPHPAWTLALLAPPAATWAVGLSAPSGSPWAAIPLWMATTLVAALLPKWRRRLLIAASALVAVAHPLLASTLSDDGVVSTDTPGLWGVLVYALALPAIILSSMWWWEIVVALDRHRAVAAELAVARERLRFASDLHDIQGHHLQVIALKSELAERMLSVDIEVAREHVHASRLIAKQALEETRTLIAGYREIGLDQELENAREVLAAAGADCDLAVDSVPDDAEVRRVLALVVREATTNILRHSDATKAWFRLSTSDSAVSLTIGNNALLVPVTIPGRASSTGLDGLRSRVSALGGTLDAAADVENDRFELRVRVPARAAVLS